MYHTQWRGTEVYEDGDQHAVQLHPASRSAAVRAMMTRCNKQQQQEVMSSVSFTDGRDIERKEDHVLGSIQSEVKAAQE